jgi:hypothetical protein
MSKLRLGIKSESPVIQMKLSAIETILPDGWDHLPLGECSQQFLAQAGRV